jgi:hypothetical protein
VELVGTLEGDLNILPSSEIGGIVETDSNSWSLTGNLPYHFAPRAFRPYAVVGLGFGHGNADVDTVVGTTRQARRPRQPPPGSISHRPSSSSISAAESSVRSPRRSISAGTCGTSLVVIWCRTTGA